MSTQTSALPDGTTLTKPAASEKVSLSVINTNTDNIANNIIGVNDKIKGINLGTVSTLSALESALDTLGTSMTIRDSRTVWVQFSTNASPFANTGYSGTFYKVFDGRYRVSFYMNANNYVIDGAKTINGWIWDAVGMTSRRTPALNTSNVTSDTFILSLEPGSYQVADNNMNTSYIPGKYGTLTVNRSGTTYASYTFIDTSGNTFVRHANGTSSWHTSWTKLATKSEVDAVGVKMSENIRVSTNGGNVSSFSFTAPRGSDAYKYFLLVGGHSSSVPFIYHGHVNTSSNNYAVTLTLMGGVAVSGLQATYNGTTITFTTTGTQWGGLRLLWLC